MNEGKVVARNSIGKMVTNYRSWCFLVHISVPSCTMITHCTTTRGTAHCYTISPELELVIGSLEPGLMTMLRRYWCPIAERRPSALIGMMCTGTGTQESGGTFRCRKGGRDILPSINIQRVSARCIAHRDRGIAWTDHLPEGHHDTNQWGETTSFSGTSLLGETLDPIRIRPHEISPGRSAKRRYNFVSFPFCKAYDIEMLVGRTVLYCEADRIEPRCSLSSPINTCNPVRGQLISRETSFRPVARPALRLILPAAMPGDLSEWSTKVF